MDWLEALVLGLVQGLTEYLPVSSSGHLEIGKCLLGVEVDGGLTFDIIVHIATVLSTLVVLWKEIAWIFCGLFKMPTPGAAHGQGPQWLDSFNEEQQYAINILISMIPIGIVGICFKDAIEELIMDNMTVVGGCLLVTALLLGFASYYKPKKGKEIGPFHAFIIGLAQAVAVLPGLSRSGSTIATGLLLGDKREKLAQFSFLMVIPPILGEALLDGKKIIEQAASGASDSIGILPLAIGFLAAFISGCFACKIMIALVKRCKLQYFAIYCAVLALITLIFLA